MFETVGLRVYVPDLLELSQLPTLQNRRLYLKLFTLKIIHGYFYFPPNVFIPQVSRNNSSLPLLYQPLAHTSAFQSSFVLFLYGTAYRTKHLPHTPSLLLGHM